jgi:hypothetical protein
MTYTLIAHTELTSAQANIEITSIPATFTDLLLVLSLRSTTGSTWTDGKLEFNNVTTGYSFRVLYGPGSGSGASFTETGLNMRVPGASSTANTFGSQSIYIPNYRSSAQKSVSIEQVTENNGTEALQLIGAGLSDITAVISSIKTTTTNGTNYAIGSSATLYGITAGSSGGVVVS